jgi:hypothetical protein
MAEVPTEVTPVPANEGTALMVTALREREGELAPRVAQHLLSLVWIETGRGTKMLNWNWGNLSGAYKGNFWRPPWYRIDASSSARMKYLHQRMLEGKAPDRFKAYPTKIEGLLDFVALMYNKPRYAPMLEAARKGDTRAFADAVHDTGYCPDDECRGERTIASYTKLTNKFAPMLGLPVVRNGSNGSGSWASIGVLVALCLLAKGGRRLFS